TNTRNKEIVANLYLTPLIIDKEIVISPIFFDFDKSTIRPDAAFELEYVVKVLKNHPKMIIKIEAHTDSRGDDAYNEILSDRRAKSTRDYILSRNIEAFRIESAIGFGEKQLVNKCANTIFCTEKEHQENRRSKFMILNDYK
ncbi:OmpA family protein, partial [Tenacibaculum finnmarkense]